MTLLGTTAHEADDLLAAQVLLRDPAPGESTLLVSRGAADGVVPGQPVLGSGGTLVGVVDAVARRRSWVRLITDSGLFGRRSRPIVPGPRGIGRRP